LPSELTPPPSFVYSHNYFYIYPTIGKIALNSRTKIRTGQEVLDFRGKGFYNQHTVMQKMHQTQQKLLEILKANIDDPLTIRELQDCVGASSPSIVHHHITKLIEKGLLRRNPSNPRDYQVLSDNPDNNVVYLNVYGMAQCGPKGSILEGNPIDRIKISSKVLGFSAVDAFVVKARGNSMIPRINPGDLIIAKKVVAIDGGEVVVCVNNGEVLIKKVQKIPTESGNITYNLISLNPEFAPFTANEDFKVEGVVRGVLSYLR
jgi:repressor LexA